MFFREMGFPGSWEGVGRDIGQGDPALISFFQEPGEPKSLINLLLDRNMAYVYEGDKNPEYDRVKAW